MVHRAWGMVHGAWGMGQREERQGCKRGAEHKLERTLNIFIWLSLDLEHA